MANSFPDVCSVFILWDVDHTLIENGGVSKENYEKAFEMLTSRRPEHPVNTDGRTDPEIMRNTLVSHGIAQVEQYMPRISEVLQEAMTSNASELRARGYAMPGARAALGAFHQAPGIVQSVLTGNIRPNALAKLAAFDLDSYIDFDVGGYGSDDNVRARLVSVAQGRARTKYGVTFDQDSTVLIGDTARDVQAGRHGGALVIAVATGADSIDELRAAGADVVLADLRDTEAIIDAVRNLTAGARKTEQN